MKTIAAVFILLCLSLDARSSTLANWNARGTNSVIVFLGDSWTSGGVITKPLRTSLQTKLGDGGWGYFSFAYNAGGHPSSGYSRSGTWTDTISTNGASLSATFSADTATPAIYNLTSTVTAFVLHYLVQPGGGTFEYSIDNGAAVPVNTAGASSIAFVTNSGLSYASHHINITITAAGTDGVGICGCDLQAIQAGCRLDNIGRTGSEASTWLTTGSTNFWKTAMQSLSPTVTIILLGVNECLSNRGGPTFSNNLANLVGMVRSAAANSDVLLVSPADIGTATTYPMSDYNIEIAGIASALSCGYVDVYDAWGTYGNPTSSGWYLNTTHPNDTGGAVIAGYIYNLLFPTPIINASTANIGTLRMAQ